VKESPDPQRATEQERFDERLPLTKTRNDKPGRTDEEEGDEGKADISGPFPRPLSPVQASVRRNDKHGQDRSEQTFGEHGQSGRNSYQGSHPPLSIAEPSQVEVHAQRYKQRHRNVLLGHETLIEELAGGQQDQRSEQGLVDR
jgi:hypothetical protein